MKNRMCKDFYCFIVCCSAILWVQLRHKAQSVSPENAAEAQELMKEMEDARRLNLNLFYCWRRIRISNHVFSFCLLEEHVFWFYILNGLWPFAICCPSVVRGSHSFSFR
jgi:hypothetical protein